MYMSQDLIWWRILKSFLFLGWTKQGQSYFTKLWRCSNFILQHLEHLQRFCNFRFAKQGVCQVLNQYAKSQNWVSPMVLAKLSCKTKWWTRSLFFHALFLSRRSIRRAGSLARSPTRCVAPLPPSLRAGAFTLRKKVGDGVLQAARASWFT